MKKNLAFALLFVLSFAARLDAQSLTSLMQMTESPYDKYRGLALGGGMSVIDGKPYFLIHVAPQQQFGPWGIGIDGNIRIGTDGKLRKEDWDEPYDYIRWLNYVSYGKPSDDLYGRIGYLEHAYIGNGTIVSDYNNSSSYDNRRIGLSARLDLGALGGEALTSDLFRRSLIALRPFVRPFRLIPILNDTWLLKDIEIGVTGAFDFDTNATRIIPNHYPYVQHYGSPLDSTFDSVVILRDSARYATPFITGGIDVSTKLWQTDKTEGRVYGDYVNFQHYNDGVIIGLRTSFDLADGILVDLRGERSLFKNHFLPNYYNTFYERDRYDDQARAEDYITKITLLSDSTGGNGNGFRAGGFISIHDKVQIQMSYSHLDNLEGKDWLDLDLALPDLGRGFFARASYARKNIDGPADIIALDDRSLLDASLSFQPYSFIILTAVSRWTFTKDGSGHVHTQSIIEPRADFIFKF